MGCSSSAGSWPALTQLRLCGCSVSALPSLAGAHRGLDKLETLHSSKQALLGLLGPRGSAGGGTWRLALGPTVSGTSCLAMPKAVLTVMPPRRAGAGRDAAAWQGGRRSMSSEAVPGGSCCGLHACLLQPACPHIASGLACSYAGHGALPRVKETQPWFLTWAAKSLDGFEMADAPGWCWSWPGACGSPEPALGSAQHGGGPSSQVAGPG